MTMPWNSVRHFWYGELPDGNGYVGGSAEAMIFVNPPLLSCCHRVPLARF